MGDEDFTAAWAEGAAAPLDEAIAYAQRGRGERKRPSNGWDALTPAEHKIVKLVTEGLVTKDIAARLFVSPRTVQTHLTHIYTKLDVTSVSNLYRRPRNTRPRIARPAQARSSNRMQYATNLGSSARCR